jgi:hypothetical protein
LKNQEGFRQCQFEISLKILHLQCPSRAGFSRDIEETDKKGIRGVCVKTKFEFKYNNGLTTKIKSDDFKYDKQLIQFQFYR